MCTVTIFPKGNNGFVLTSNRDETPNRKTLAPDFYTIKNTTLLFPKDELAGGTWIGISEKNRLICLLNGAFENHKKKSNYRYSRGIVVNDFLIADNIEICMKNYLLDDIEPFTIVVADWNTNLAFYELVWDGHKKHITKLPLEPKVWSSSTLYNQNMKAERLQWFENFKAENELTAESALKFHKTAGKSNSDYGVIMNRNAIKTTSITQVNKINDHIEMRYENRQDNTLDTKTFKTPQVVNE
ncbi:NRDE family protein [Algibacter miyuki]|uniref:NRDE family protein n=1 Tax=Algibacter miyuki TaxID=1306933 RepID=A0ABV5GZQ8_9FLAO|nr:NRDE family protein [Algibacter miyuki]MDN3666696.1 NRDE family protein [Algibacter miyuki]